MGRELGLRTAAGKDVLLVVAGRGEDVGRLAAQRVADSLLASADEARPFVLGLPAGRTSIALYARLAELYRSRELSFRNAASFALDEYLGLPPFHVASFRRFLDEHLFDHVDFAKSRAHFLDGLTHDAVGTCAHYERAIQAAGGIDLQILGLGPDGHIGFNEPGTPAASRTRRVVLTERMREWNVPSFGVREAVPSSALTLGIGTILEARRACVLAQGMPKAEAVRASLLDPPSDTVPASHLQTGRGELVFILDEASASGLTSALSPRARPERAV